MVVHVQLLLHPQTLYTQSAEVYSQIVQVHRGFLQVEERVTFVKLSLKATQDVDHGVSGIILEEQLQSLPWVLDITEQVSCHTGGIVAPPLQRGFFRDRDTRFTLSH